MNTLQIGDVWHHEKPGGLGRYFCDLLRALPSAGAHGTGLVLGSEHLEKDEGDDVVAFARAQEPMPQRMMKLHRAAMAQLREHRMDVIAGHFAPYLLPILNSRLDVPRVMHFHGPWAAESSEERGASAVASMKLWMERTVYQRASRLIVLSDYFREELRNRYGVNEDRIRMVPGGVDTTRFDTIGTRAQARATLGWPNDRFILLAVRRHVRRMGLEQLIDALKLLVAQRPDALLMLGGTGPIEQELEQRIQSLGLGHHVRRLGRIDESLLPTVFRAADISVVPSRALEGFGLVVLESLACGTPVLVTNVGGLPEIVMPFAPQCVFADTSAASMASALAQAASGELLLPDEQSCRAYAVSKFSWPVIAKRVREVYDEAAA